MKHFCSFIVIAIFVTACDPFNTILNEKDVFYYEDVENKSPVSFAPGDSLKIMTWNVKFGGGRINFFFDCHGDRIAMDSTEVMANIESIADFINRTKPDILFVQEIDVNSKRSAFINQAEKILEKTHFRYAVYSPQWRAIHIPSDGLGRMNSGNAIFSVAPLFEGKRISLPLIKEQNFLVRYFYLRRHLLEVRSVITEDTIRLLNTHLSAYSNDGTKKKQLDIVLRHLDSLKNQGTKFIMAGDFNTLPPETKKVKDFPDSACEGEFEADNFSGEEEWMIPFFEHFNPAVPLALYKFNNQPYFTHSTSASHFWNRKLDYIFSNMNVIPDSSVTYQTFEKGGLKPMALSDHCAIKTCIY